MNYNFEMLLYAMQHDLNMNYLPGTLSTLRDIRGLCLWGSHVSQCWLLYWQLWLCTEKISFKNAPSLQEFNEGDNADIVCDVVSSPPATIFWKHKGAKIHVAKDGERNEVTNNEEYEPSCSIISCIYVYL